MQQQISRTLHTLFLLQIRLSRLLCPIEMLKLYSCCRFLGFSDARKGALMKVVVHVPATATVLDVEDRFSRIRRYITRVVVESRFQDDNGRIMSLFPCLQRAQLAFTSGEREISHINHVKAVEELWISWIGMRDVTQLSMLTNTTRLVLRLPMAENLESLSALSRLQILDLRSTTIHNLSFCRPLAQLKSLTIENGFFTSLSPLENMLSMERLVLNNCQRVTNIAPVSRMLMLRYLSLVGSGITQVHHLTELRSLESLNLKSTFVSDITALSSLKLLEYLNLSYTPVTAIFALRPLIRLQSLHLENTDVEDISPLQHMFYLRMLNLNGTQVRDLTALKNLVRLEGLEVERTLVEDLQPLNGLIGLQELSVSWTRVSDLSPILNLGLERLEREGIFESLR